MKKNNWYSQCCLLPFYMRSNLLHDTSKGWWTWFEDQCLFMLQTSKWINLQWIFFWPLGVCQSKDILVEWLVLLNSQPFEVCNLKPFLFYCNWFLSGVSTIFCIFYQHFKLKDSLFHIFRDQHLWYHQKYLRYIWIGEHQRSHINEIDVYDINQHATYR